MSMASPALSRQRYTASPTGYHPLFVLLELTAWAIKEFCLYLLKLLFSTNVIERLEYSLLGVDPATLRDSSSLESIQERYRLVGTPWRKAPHVLGEERVQYDLRVREIKQKRERLESLLFNVYQEEQAAIIKWIIDHDLNEYGDPKYTSYGEGHRGRWGPLINYDTGESITLYTYLLRNHPNRPWFNDKRNLIRRLLKDQDPLEVSAIVDWIIQNNLNHYGDSYDTTYLPNGPLFNLITGHSQTLYEYLCDMHPSKPWVNPVALTSRVTQSLERMETMVSTQQFDRSIAPGKSHPRPKDNLLEELDNLTFLLDD